MTNEPSKHTDFEDLIVGHFDGTLNEKQEAELAKTLGTSPEAKQLFLSYMRMEGRLHSLGGDGFLRGPETEARGCSSPVKDDTKVALGEQSSSRALRSRLIAASTSVAVCAAVILMVSAWVLAPASVSASSVLMKAQRAAAELVDRTYRLTISHSDVKKGHQVRELTITLRGGGRFVVRPVDNSYVMGSDGDDYWLALKSGPVWVTRDFRTLAPELQRKIPNRRLLEMAASPEEPLLLKIDSLLSLIEHRFDVQLVDSGDETLHRVRATLRSGKRNGPSWVDLWSDVESGVLHRIEMEYSKHRHAIFELGETPALSEDWYHYSEHAPDRDVERITAW